ncbi:MAG: hypothetical protein A2Z21_07750 [Candidatus Fraserbacteria bacterium RBG_16_55_9]|uniref:Glycosyltransferase subfamily 4-like N-terminal domain-containing protein n=1 Tax=Fraserbacteria sp. (strain RBG_16_55_9) TaxID=1817864 RepID=A0A1F5UVZ7_FRAXR|nr:MAG: hypothetical protein A2Z21_07750 [Candidatus Fraserbacteria bacterium RBG_16_55_9]
MPTDRGNPLIVLRLSLEISEESAPFNQFSLALRTQQDITICTYFKSHFAVPDEITLFEGDDTLRGFFRALRAALANKRYDIIHVHAPHLGVLFLVANSFQSWDYIRSAVYTIHNSYQSYRLRNKLMLVPVIAFYRRIVCCGYSSLESFPRPLKWLAGSRMVAVQNGADIERVDRCLRKGVEPPEERPFTVISVGRLIDKKRPATVLRAFQKVNHATGRLVFVGEGSLRADLVAEAEALGMGKRVHMAGLVPREEVYVQLRRADIFVSASRMEGLPVAVLEAMACQCPVVLSDIPPHREIASGVDFIPLIQPNDVNGFAKEMSKFQSMSPAERLRIGERCRELVEERFSLSAMHRGYMRVYEEVIVGNHR